MDTCIRVFRKNKSVSLPRYATKGSAGADLEADIPEDIILYPGEWKKIPTGLSLEIPRGWEAQLRPRSGLALRQGLTVLNAPGTIDSDYRGELEVILINLGKEPHTILKGDRIAQLVFSPAPQVIFKEIYELNCTERDIGGFGSTDN
ncbi:MAG: dUTP diphosphatase [Treponema sp.]|jgi:dUTP pyrophosphatase|nr:dUTP diphosphatase [Treponema sp.]